jgi:hypothetical protein
MTSLRQIEAQFRRQNLQQQPSKVDHDWLIREYGEPSSLRPLNMIDAVAGQRVLALLR